MRSIQILTDEIKEELEGAKNYAEKYVEYKVKANSANEVRYKELSNRYKEMANDELRHSALLHEQAVTAIEESRKVITPPEEMLERWNKAHAYYVDKTAWIKQMLAM